MKHHNISSFLSIFVIFFFSAVIAWADGDEGFIYGKITMDNGNEYQGVIRWGDEEAFWDDMFNSTKVDDMFEQYLYDVNIDDLEDEIDDAWYGDRRRKRGIFRFNFDDHRPGETTHQFKCRFGDIKRMEFRGSKSVLLTFKNGEEMRIKGGSNDIGTSIQIIDDELDEVQLKWRRIDIVEFLPTPKSLKYKFGDPLYGEVETRRGRFKGFIQWDNDECLSEDVLDGDSEDGDMEIRFENIRSIEKYRRGSLVTLKSGRELYLTGSNDVDSDNRGVVVKSLDMGRVLIGWREFEKIIFQEPNGTGPSYDEFTGPKMLAGTVRIGGDETLSGRLIFDLDEAYDFEILDGEDGRIEYKIPFRNIRSIVPKGRYGSMIRLKNGEELELEDERDVDDDNDGIVVWQGKDQLKYVPWRRVEEIAFE